MKKVLRDRKVKKRSKQKTQNKLDHLSEIKSLDHQLKGRIKEKGQGHETEDIVSQGHEIENEVVQGHETEGEIEIEGMEIETVIETERRQREIEGIQTEKEETLTETGGSLREIEEMIGGQDQGHGLQEEEGRHLEGHHQGVGQGQEIDIGHQAELDLRGVRLQDVGFLLQGEDDHPPRDLGHQGPGGLKRVEDGTVLPLPENRGPLPQPPLVTVTLTVQTPPPPLEAHRRVKRC